MHSLRCTFSTTSQFSKIFRQLTAQEHYSTLCPLFFLFLQETLTLDITNEITHQTVVQIAWYIITSYCINIRYCLCFKYFVRSTFTVWLKSPPILSPLSTSYWRERQPWQVCGNNTSALWYKQVYSLRDCSGGQWRSSYLNQDRRAMIPLICEQWVY